MAGSLGAPLARITAEGFPQAASSSSTQQVGSNPRSSLWKRKDQCQKIIAWNRETWTASWSAAWLQAPSQLKHGYTWQGNSQQDTFRGSARTVKKTCKGPRVEHYNRMHRMQNFEHGDPENLTRHMLCVKEEAWRISDTWMTVTSFATQRWPSLVKRPLTPNEQVGIHKQKTEVMYCVADLDGAGPVRCAEVHCLLKLVLDFRLQISGCSFTIARTS